MFTRVEYRDEPRGSGWYVCRYATEHGLAKHLPDDVIGPYDTEAAGKRAAGTILDKELGKTEAGVPC